MRVTFTKGTKITFCYNYWLVVSVLIYCRLAYNAVSFDFMLVIMIYNGKKGHNGPEENTAIKLIEKRKETGGMKLAGYQGDKRSIKTGTIQGVGDRHLSKFAPTFSLKYPQKDQKQLKQEYLTTLAEKANSLF